MAYNLGRHARDRPDDHGATFALGKLEETGHVRPVLLVELIENCGLLEDSVAPNRNEGVARPSGANLLSIR